MSGPTPIAELLVTAMADIERRIAWRRRAEDLLDQIDLAKEHVEALSRELALPVEEN